jgi:hypothetical protein
MSKLTYYIKLAGCWMECSAETLAEYEAAYAELERTP